MPFIRAGSGFYKWHFYIKKGDNKMSKFSVFMKQNKVQKNNEKYAPTESLIDANGKAVNWEFRHITSKENEELRDANTIDVQVTGKPNLYRPKLNTSKYLMAMIVKSTVYPDLYDKELQDSYGVMTPEDLVYAIVDDAGEMQDFQLWMQKFQGFTKSLDEKVDEAKN
nr:MAG TPA: tail assembly chaperone protein [Caudoviricetes sp.]